MSRSFRWTV